MAQFNSLIGAILQDMIRAQHEANLYSLWLRDQYCPKVTSVANKEFRVPGALISQLELELKYAFQKTDVRREEAQTDFTTLKCYLSDLAEQLARIAITNVTSTLGNADDQDTYALGLLIAQEQHLWQGFGVFLARKINEILQTKVAKITNKQGALNKELILDSVMSVVQIHLLDNAELASMFEGEMHQRAKNNLAYTLSLLIAKRTKDYNFVRTQAFSSPEIIVTANELKKLPPDAIHSIRISVSPQNLRPDEPVVTNFV